MARTTRHLLAALSTFTFAAPGCIVEPADGTSPDPSCAADDASCVAADMASGGRDSGSTPIEQDMQGTTPTADMTGPPRQDMTGPPRQDMNTTPPKQDMSMPQEPVCASVTSCQAGDGCCPSSCDATNDSDCVVDCHDYDSWPQNWADEEAELIALVNVERGKGANCGSRGSFAATGPVQMNRALQIAARCHSVDMVGRGGLDHTGTDGSSFSERARREGYAGSPRGENIAAGNQTAARTVGQWMNSDGHCANIMKDGIDRMGIGYFTGDVRFTHYWTMVTGKGGQ